MTTPSTITIRVSPEDREQLANLAASQRLNLSELVRVKLGLGARYEAIENAQDERFESHERRISRLEEMAGL